MCGPAGEAIASTLMDASETRLQLTERDGRVVLSGEIDASTCAVLDDWLDQYDNAGPLVLDMSEVSFIDSSGLRVLVAQQQKSTESGNAFEVVDASRAALRLFEITGLAEVLGVRTT